MPIYEYQCPKCGLFEAMQRITESPLRKCPTCKSKVERLVSRSSFVLKGSGWYATDYANKGKSSESESGDSASSNGSDSKDSASKSESAKSESSKSESSSDPKGSTEKTLTAKTPEKSATAKSAD